MFEKQISQQIDEALQPLKEELAELKKKNERLEGSIKDLKQEIKRLNQRLDMLSRQKEQNQWLKAEGAQAASPSDSADPHVNSRVSSRQLYLSTPTPDGFFAEAYEQKREGKSIYHLETKDGQNATFRILDTPDALATALISISQFVKPACKVNGQVAGMPRGVETEQEGQAVCEQGGWRVTRKAVIRFI